MAVSSHPKSFKPVGIALQKTVRSIGGKRGFNDQSLISRWVDYVGADLSTLCQPREIKSFRGKPATLVVDCLSAHASEVSMRVEELRGRINGALGYDAIGKIQLHHQHIGFGEPKAQFARKAIEKKPVPSEVEHKLAKTMNDELRLALQGISESFYNKGD